MLLFNKTFSPSMKISLFFQNFEIKMRLNFWNFFPYRFYAYFPRKFTYLTLFFSVFSFRKCRVVAEIHNSYVFNTFNEYQREVLPKELRCYKSQFTYLMFLFSPFSEQQHRSLAPSCIFPHIVSMDSHFTLSQQQ